MDAEKPKHIMKTNSMSRSLYEVDSQVASATDNEVRRQHQGLELMASEKIVSEAEARLSRDVNEARTRLTRDAESLARLAAEKILGRRV